MTLREIAADDGECKKKITTGMREISKYCLVNSLTIDFDGFSVGCMALAP